jgi:beta-N-acetylhexosaminidase
MELESRIGQLFFVGVQGTGETPALREILRELRPGGVMLFTRNIHDPAQVRALNDAIRGAIDPPPFIAVDQEGGRVSRLRSLLPPLPSAAELSRRGPARIRDYAQALGRALAALGFDTDFAPVVDLSAPGAANLIGDRSFGEDEAAVTDCARAFIAGMDRAGIACFLKHFPGLGATDVDSHVALPVLSREPSELWRRDLLPFRECAPGAAGVMIGHVHCPGWDPGAPLASSLSPAIVTGLLRDRIGYDGIALTDDLEMGAVASLPPAALARLALEAGCDMAMFCNDPGKAREAVAGTLAAARSGDIAPERIQRSVERILAAKRRFGIDGARPAAAPEEWPSALEELSARATE